MKKTKDKLGSFLEYFSRLEDPRIERKKLYPLDEILLVVLCGTICGAEGWDEFQWFAQQKIAFLKSYLPFKNGIPSRFTYSRRTRNNSKIYNFEDFPCPTRRM